MSFPDFINSIDFLFMAIILASGYGITSMIDRSPNAFLKQWKAWAVLFIGSMMSFPYVFLTQADGIDLEGRYVSLFLTYVLSVFLYDILIKKFIVALEGLFGKK